MLSFYQRSPSFESLIGPSWTVTFPRSGSSVIQKASSRRICSSTGKSKLNDDTLIYKSPAAPLMPGEKITRMSTTTVFFSWQSDRPTREGRNLIAAALDAAVQRISQDLEVDEPSRPQLQVDRD